MRIKLFGIFAIAMTVGSGAAFAGIDGMYVRKSGGVISYLQAYDCKGGKGLKVVRSTHKPSIGKHIICGAKKKGAKWHGKVFDIENNKTYTGYISLSGTDLKITGCYLGICRSKIMKRAK